MVLDTIKTAAISLFNKQFGTLMDSIDFNIVEIPANYECLVGYELTSDVDGDFCRLRVYLGSPTVKDLVPYRLEVDRNDSFGDLIDEVMVTFGNIDGVSLQGVTEPVIDPPPPPPVIPTSPIYGPYEINRILPELLNPSEAGRYGSGVFINNAGTKVVSFRLNGIESDGATNAIYVHDYVDNVLTLEAEINFDVLTLPTYFVNTFSYQEAFSINQAVDVIAISCKYSDELSVVHYDLFIFKKINGIWVLDTKMADHIGLTSAPVQFRFCESILLLDNGARIAISYLDNNSKGRVEIYDITQPNAPVRDQVILSPFYATELTEFGLGESTKFVYNNVGMAATSDFSRLFIADSLKDKGAIYYYDYSVVSGDYEYAGIINPTQLELGMPTPSYHVGERVLVSADGNTVVALNNDSTKNYAFIFKKVLGNYVLETKIYPDAEDATQRFGNTGYLSPDGTKLFICDTDYYSWRGAVFVYEYINGLWSFLCRVDRFNATLESQSFASGCCYSPAKDVLAVGAEWDSPIVGSEYLGCVYLFSKQLIGVNAIANTPDTIVGPNEVQIINDEELEMNATFGQFMAVSDNGAYIAVLIPMLDTPGWPNQLRFNVYKKNNLNYVLVDSIKQSYSGVITSTKFTDIAISPNGMNIAVKDTFNGIVRLFNNNGNGDWAEIDPIDLLDEIAEGNEDTNPGQLQFIDNNTLAVKTFTTMTVSYDHRIEIYVNNANVWTLDETIPASVFGGFVDKFHINATRDKIIFVIERPHTNIKLYDRISAGVWSEGFDVILNNEKGFYTKDMSKVFITDRTDPNQGYTFIGKVYYHEVTGTPGNYTLSAAKTLYPDEQQRNSMGYGEDLCASFDGSKLYVLTSGKSSAPEQEPLIFNYNLVNGDYAKVNVMESTFDETNVIFYTIYPHFITCDNTGSVVFSQAYEDSMTSDFQGRIFVYA